MMNFVEFIEALARIAQMFSILPSDYTGKKSIPLDLKL